MDQWLVPRKLTLPLMLLIFGALGQSAWYFAPSVKFLSFICSFGLPFCMTCAAFVWGLREKAEAFLINDQLSSSQYQRARKVEDSIQLRSMMWASIAAIAGLVAVIPIFSKETFDAIWQWMVICAFLSVGVAIYAYMVAYSWDRQLRAYRDKQKIDTKLEVEKQKLIDRIENSSLSLARDNWANGPELIQPNQQH